MRPFDQSGTFDHDVASGGLRRVAVRSAGFTVFGQGVGFLLQMIATVVLARLLTPADFGLVIMVTTFSLFLANFGLNGLTEAVLQREKLDHRVASNLFWINVACGLLLALAFAAAGPLLARFYDDVRVVGVVRALSLTIFVTSLSVLHLALLKRAMRFAAVSMNDMLARAAAVLVSVLLAMWGWGYWALVGGAVGLPLVTCAGAWTVCRWVPGIPRRDQATLPMIRFALNTYGRFAASYLTWNLDNFLLGWRFGAAPLGLYKKAYDLFILPVNQLSCPLTAVAVSTLSRLNGNPAQYRRYFLSALSTLAFLGMGLGAYLTLAGRDVIFLLLGAGWEESGRIFTFFGPGIGIMLLYYTHGWIHLSIGRADRAFRWGLVEIGVTALFFLAGLPWGPAGMAVAWVASVCVLTIPGLWYAGKPVGLEISSVVGAVWRYVLASALAGCIAAAVLEAAAAASAMTSWSGALSRIVMTGAIFWLLYLLAVVVLHRGLGPIRQVTRILNDLIPFPSRSGGLMRSAQMVRNAVRGLLQAYGTGGIKRYLWNTEFSRGRWDCPERAAGDFAYAHVETYANDGSILDLGCGAGRTASDLDRTRYRRYTGVDISDVALETARRTAETNDRGICSRFVQSDISSYEPTEQHDVILFMESLYYVPWGRIPAVLARYAKYLTEDGVFIVRMWTGSDKYMPIVSIIERDFDVVDTRWSDEPKAVLLVFRPRLRRQHAA